MHAFNIARSSSSDRCSTARSSSFGLFTPMNGSTGISPSSANHEANRRTPS
jgi:hypothetical protein